MRLAAACLLTLIGCLAFMSACGSSSEPAPGGSAPANPGSSGSASTAPKSTDGGSAAGSSSLDACKLLTPEEVGRVTGLTGVTPVANTPGDPSFCIYGTGAGVQATMLTYSKSGAARDFEALATGTQSVSGLGEKAYWQPTGKTLSILKNGTMLQISAVAGLSDAEVPADKRQDLSKQLAAIAVARQ